MGFIDVLLGMIAPHICVGCGQEGTLLCPVCGVGLLVRPAGQPTLGNLQSVQAATAYDGIARDLVWRLKFRGAPAAAGVMARHMAPLITEATGSLIIPVPTATRRVRQRGFDQAKLLARLLSKRTGLRYADYLQRRGQTHQVGASRSRRLSQLEAAFRLKNRADLLGCQVILVDDVLTTGATLEAAAALLRAAGTRHINAVVFAQAD